MRGTASLDFRVFGAKIGLGDLAVGRWKKRDKKKPSKHF